MKLKQALPGDDDYFRALVDGVTDYAICRLDWEGRVASWNVGAEWVNGYETNEIIGRHFSCFYPAETVADGHPARVLSQAIAQGRFQEEIILLRKGEIPFWADVAITPLRDVPEDLRGFALVVRDITARKEFEGERERVIQELQSTLNNVKILSGLVPICASCKKVRDYTGQWHPLEVYLQGHSEATLVHEFCDQCTTLIQPAGRED